MSDLNNDTRLLMQQGIFMPEIALTGVSVRVMNEWAERAFAAIRADEREKAAQRVQEVPYWVDEGIANDTKLITMDFAIAAALDDPAYREWIQIITEERAAARRDGAE